VARPAPTFPQEDLQSFLRDPYPILARLRAEAPVAFIPRPLLGPAYFVSRYDDVLAVLRDDDRFAHEPGNAGQKQRWIQGKLTLGLGDTMIMKDDPDHRRLRGLVHKAFTPARVEALKARVGVLVSQLLDRLQAKGQGELIKDLALPLPITVISELMGIPEPDRVKFRRLVDGLVDVEGRGLWGLLSTIPKVARLFREFDHRLKQHEAQETALIMLAFNSDIGIGD